MKEHLSRFLGPRLEPRRFGRRVDRWNGEDLLSKLQPCLPHGDDEKPERCTTIRLFAFGSQHHWWPIGSEVERGIFEAGPFRLPRDPSEVRGLHDPVGQPSKSFHAASGIFNPARDFMGFQRPPIGRHKESVLG